MENLQLIGAIYRVCTGDAATAPKLCHSVLDFITREPLFFNLLFDCAYRHIVISREQKARSQKFQQFYFTKIQTKINKY